MACQEEGGTGRGFGPILAAACSPDGTLAVSHHTNDIHIYQQQQGGSSEPASTGWTWPRVATLTGHEQVVSGLDWAPSGRGVGGGGTDNVPLLVSCSHDRTTAVWERCGTASGTSTSASDDAAWRRQPVMQRLPNSALCVRWSPSGSKFAVGSSAKCVGVQYWDEAAGAWMCRLIRDKHGSSVVAVAWHPSSWYLATASTDCKCRVIGAALPGELMWHG